MKVNNFHMKKSNITIYIYNIPTFAFSEWLKYLMREMMKMAKHQKYIQKLYKTHNLKCVLSQFYSKVL